MNSNEKDYMEIDLMRLLKALLHRAWAIVIAVFAGALVAFACAALLITPLYKARALLYVNNNSINLGSASLSIGTGDITASRGLVDTYTVILKTRTTLNAVIEKAGLPYDYEELYKMIETSSVNNTEIFEIVVTSHDPKEAEVIANTSASVLPEKISNIVNGSSAKLVDYAVVPSKKDSPSITKYTIIGALLGFIISAGVIIVMELMDNLIKDEEYLLQTYKLPVLAAVPDLDAETSSSYGGYGYGYGSKNNKVPSGGKK